MTFDPIDRFSCMLSENSWKMKIIRLWKPFLKDQTKLKKRNNKNLFCHYQYPFWF